MSDENKDIPELPDDFDVPEEEKPKKSKTMKMVIIGGVIFAVILVSASAAWIMMSKKKAKKHTQAPVVQQEASANNVEPVNPLLSSAPALELNASSDKIEAPKVDSASAPVTNDLLLDTQNNVEKKVKVEKTEETSQNNNEVTAKNEKKRDTILVHKKKIHKKQTYAHKEKTIKAPKEPARDIEQMVDHDETRFDRIF